MPSIVPVSYSLSLAHRHPFLSPITSQFVTFNELEIISSKVLSEKLNIFQFCPIVLPPFQILVCSTLLTSKVWPLVLFKNLCKISLFYCGLLYPYEFFKNDLNLTIFVQIFWISWVVKLRVEKSNDLQFRMEGVLSNKLCLFVDLRTFVRVTLLQSAMSHVCVRERGV